MPETAAVRAAVRHGIGITACKGSTGRLQARLFWGAEWLRKQVASTPASQAPLIYEVYLF